MQCGHEGCTCEVNEGFCSDFCRDHGDHTEATACACGHDACAGTIAS